VFAKNGAINFLALQVCSKWQPNGNQRKRHFWGAHASRDTREIGLAEKLNAAAATSPLTGFLTR